MYCLITVYTILFSNYVSLASVNRLSMFPESFFLNFSKLSFGYLVTDPYCLFRVVCGGNQIDFEMFCEL